jgi:hypothetical protein
MKKIDEKSSVKEDTTLAERLIDNGKSMMEIKAIVSSCNAY